MSGFLLCQKTAAPAPACAEPFVCRASGWIDESNFGGPEPARVPSGIRLRWNSPYLADNLAARLHGFPRHFDVYRSAPFDGDALFAPDPTVGHTPRSLALRSCWTDMQEDRNGFRVSRGDPCAEAQAVYCELDAGAPPVEVSVLDVNGETLAVAYVQEGDRFYLEASRIGSVLFSARPRLRNGVLCLAPAVNLDINYSKISTVDARVWLTAPLHDLVQRFSRRNGSVLLTTDEKMWATLQQYGVRVMRALDNGRPPGEEALALQTAAALKWEIAALMGWAFIDGEHARGVPHDVIAEHEMLQTPSAAVYAYKVIARFQDDKAKLDSAVHFTQAQVMPALTAPAIRQIETPSVVLQGVNRGKITGDLPISYPTAPALGFDPPTDEEVCSCTAVYEVRSANPWVERTTLQPWASDSALTQASFVPMGEFLSGADEREPPVYRNLSVLERRRFNFEIPFVDSTVWLKVTAGDFWDRSLECGDTAPVLPRFDYAGKCIPLQQAACNAPARTVDWSMDDKLFWKADRFTRLNPAHIDLLGRRPDMDALEIEGEIGRISVHRCGGLQVELRRPLSQAQRDRLVSGTMETSALIFQILGFEQVGATTFIRLDAMAECGAVIAPPISHATRALFKQSPASDELWTTLGRVQVTPDGSPSIKSGTVDLRGLGDLAVILQHSMPLRFATRLAVQYQGQVLTGPITPPVTAPYLHDLPETPELCVHITQLGSDYHGRSFIRLEAQSCDEFDDRYLLRTTCTPGWTDDAAKVQQTGAPGIFPPQAPFQASVAFEAFEMLAHCEDGQKFTAAISYVRAADGLEGRCHLVQFRAKENGG